jgi:HSP20 family protein
MFKKKLKEEEKKEVSEEGGSELLFADSDAVGELAIDVFQTPTEIVIQSPIAGVNPEDVEVHIENDMITIRGRREKQEVIEEKDYFYQECYWGGFSRTVALPTSEVDIDKAQADMKNGVLMVRIPRAEKKKSKRLKIVLKE